MLRHRLLLSNTTDDPAGHSLAVVGRRVHKVFEFTRCLLAMAKVRKDDSRRHDHSRHRKHLPPRAGRLPRAAGTEVALLMAATPPLGRRLLAEAVGTGLLVTVVVGSGIAATNLTPDNVGLQLFYNSTATVFGLATLILLVGPVSGAHLNPVVSAVDWWLGRGPGTGLPGREVGAYAVAQMLGGIAGALLANVMFDVPQGLSTKDRSDWHLWVGEVVATAGLVALIFALARSNRGAWAAPAVGIYIGAAYWFASSTSFANPAVTLGRMFSDTFTGIAAGSVPGFIAAQLVGGGAGAALVRALYPDVAVTAADVVVPHEAVARNEGIAGRARR